MDETATMYTGPLGSRIHILRADPGTVAALAAIDWNASFSRVCLDPVRGLITLMSPSRLHDDFRRHPRSPHRRRRQRRHRRREGPPQRPSPGTR